MDHVSEPVIERFSSAGVASADVIIAQTRYGAVIALDGATGEQLWRWATRDPDAQVACDEQRVYISAANSARPTLVEVDPPPGWGPQAGSHGEPRAHVPRITAQFSSLTALSARDGSVLWRSTLYGARIAPPVYHLGDLVVTWMLAFDSSTREVIALDAATGALRWSWTVGPLLDDYSLPTRWNPLVWVAGGRIAVTELDASASDATPSQSYALLDARTGAVTWRGDTAPPNPIMRGVADGVRYETVEQGPAWPHVAIRATRDRDDAELWRVPCANSAGMPPVPEDLVAHMDHVVALGGGTWRACVYALDGATGRIQWRWRSPLWLMALWLLRQAVRRAQQAENARSWRTFWGDALRLRWRRPVRPDHAAALETRGQICYVASYQGVVALRASDGRRAWHGLPLVAVSRLYLAPAASGQ